MCETRGLDEEGNVIPELPEVCNGCGHCVNVCPAKGIEAKPISIKEMIERFRRWKKSQSHIDSVILSLLEISSSGALLFSMFAAS
ncbi:4Fe-4S binding domain-containing protein [Desulfurobacterium pacificum]|jgi:ferredoxin|uniref:4Fe-4S binding domain-containing protein n=2 Tax=Desulfurobacterium pacificum TaxID=240166 RepID=A0ABY1NP81_9BACT|nr:4Fe-4S binding domain-containing protein [Desulfurobacterium pacificum]